MVHCMSAIILMAIHTILQTILIFTRVRVTVPTAEEEASPVVARVGDTEVTVSELDAHILALPAEERPGTGVHIAQS